MRQNLLKKNVKSKKRLSQNTVSYPNYTGFIFRRPATNINPEWNCRRNWQLPILIKIKIWWYLPIPGYPKIVNRVAISPIWFRVGPRKLPQTETWHSATKIRSAIFFITTTSTCNFENGMLHTFQDQGLLTETRRHNDFCHFPSQFSLLLESGPIFMKNLDLDPRFRFAGQFGSSAVLQ